MLRFANLEAGDEFVTRRDGDTFMVWRKISGSKAVVVKVSGKIMPRWLGVIDNFEPTGRVYAIKLV